MKLSTFKGGIHPYEGKELSKDRPVREISVGGEYVFPVQQHIGAPAVPAVKPGERVLVGQTIAQAGGFVSANVISSVSGKVKLIEPRLTANGAYVNSIVIENDEKYETVPGYGQKRDYKALDAKEIRDAIRAAGIVGMGGAGFPTDVKLTPKDPASIDYVIVNGAECEPYLTSDYREMMEHPEEVVRGLEVELSLFENAKGIIGIENNKRDAIELFTKLVQGHERISVHPLKTKYPQGGERTLIYACTKRQINSSMLPADAGCVVSNIDTVLSVKRAVCDGLPLITRTITVTGDCVKEPCNFHIRCGASYNALLEAAGGLVKEAAKMISGGPMMGQALYSTDIPVTKTSSALTVLSRDDAYDKKESACIRCGKCADVCPGGVVPQILMKYALAGDWEGYEAAGGMECCECGCCTYICPAGRKLTQAFKTARRNVMAARRRKGGK
ncbi:MAG: electron transport complex subunit RsxC [Lachnospiraceae bacterium]|nr:electron transport complex subunit RsxC [Lachnospiraceae bacterium]